MYFMNNLFHELVRGTREIKGERSSSVVKSSSDVLHAVSLAQRPAMWASFSMILGCEAHNLAT